MENEENSLESNTDNSVGSGSFGINANSTSNLSPNEKPIIKSFLLKFGNRAVILTVTAVVIILLTGIVGLVLSSQQSNKSKSTDDSSLNNYKVGGISLKGVSASPQLQASQANQLAVNGELQVNGSLVLTPTAVPSSPIAGQIYYSQTTNAPYYYNGSQFISLAPTVLPQHVSSIGGVTGSISVGDGIQVTGDELSLSSAVLNSSSGNGVSSLQGETGSLTLSGGNGVNVNGTTINNTGVISLAAGSANVIISQDGSGNYTLTDSSVVGSGTTGQIALFTGGETLGSSILSQNSNVLTTSGNLSVTGAVLTNNISQTAAGNDVNISAGSNNLIFTAGGRTFEFPVNGSTTQTICTTGASCASGGGTAVLLQPGTPQLDTGSGSSIYVNNSGGGNLLELQGAGSDRFVVTNSGNVTISSLGSGIVESNSGLLSSGSINRDTNPYLTGTLSVANGGTGDINETANGIIYGSGTGALQSTSSVPNSILTTNNSNVPGLSQTLPATVQGNITTTGVLASGAISTGFGNISTSNNITTTTALQGGSLSVASGDFTVNSSGNIITTGMESIQGSGGLSLGVAGTTNGTLVFSNSSNSHTTTLQGLAPSGQNQTITIPASDVTSDTVCLLNLANCVGTGGSITSSGGTQYYLPKYTNSGGTQLGNSLIYDNGTTIGIANSSPGASYKLDVAGNTNTSGNAKIGAGITVTGNSYITGTLTSLTGLTSSGTVDFSSLNSVGVVHTDSSGDLSTGPVVLGTDTSGSYVSNLGSLSGLTTSGNSGPSSTPTLSVNYGSIANTAVQGNTSLTCASGTGNLSGGGNSITLGSGGSCSNLTITNSPIFSGTLAVQGSGGETIGVAGSTAGVLNLANNTNSNLSSLTASAPTGTGNATYNLPSIAGGSSDTVCLESLGNCVGSGDGVTASGGNANYISKFVSSQNLTSSSIYDNGSFVGINTTTNEGQLSVIASGTQAGLYIQGAATGTTAVSVVKSGGSSGDLLDLDNSSGAVLAKINNVGMLTSVGANFSGNIDQTAGTTTFSSLGSGLVSANGSGLLSSGTVDRNSNTYFNNSLSVINGGTGVSNLTTNGILYGNNTGSIQVTSSADNSVLVTDGSSAPSLSQTLPITVQSNITSTGSLSNGSISSGFGIINTSNNISTTSSIQGEFIDATGSGSSIELNGLNINTAGTLSNLAYLNATQTFSGSNTFSGAGTALTINNNASVDGSLTTGSLTVNNNAIISGILSVEGSSVTIGNAAVTTGNLTFANSANSNLGNLQIAPLGQDTIYTLPDPGTTTATICLNTGNCAGSGGGITGSGISGDLALFNSSGSLTNSANLSEAGSVVTDTGSLSIQGNNSLSLGVANTHNGAIVFQNSTNANTVTLQSGVSASSFNLTLPTTEGNNGDCLISDGSGDLSFESCTGGAGGGVTSLDTESGVLTLANSTASSGTLTINSASTSSMGIAEFNSNNFTASAGLINTIQNIATSAAPTFNGLTLSNQLTVINGGTGSTSLTLNGILYGNGTSAIQSTSAAANSILATGGGNIPSLTQTLPSAVQNNITSTGSLSSGSIASGFGTIATGSNISTSASLQGGTLNISGGNFTVDASGNIIGAGTLAVQGNNLTIGKAGTTGGNLSFANSSSTNLVTLQGLNPTGTGNATVQIPSIAAGSTDTVCLLNLANCVGTGGGLSTTGGVQNYLTKYNNAGTTQLTSSELYDNGSFVGLNTTTNSAQLSILSSSASEAAIFVQGAANASTPVAILRSGATPGAGGDLLQLQNSVGSVLAKIDSAGNLTSAGATFSSLNSVGVVHTDSSGDLSTGPVVLGTDTSGSYVSNLGSLSGLTTSGNSGPSSTPTLSVNYGSIANTAVQGNTSLTCASGTGNLSGGGNSITLGSGGSCSNLTITNSPIFSGTLAVQGSGGETIGVAGSTAGVLNLANNTNSNLSSLTASAPTGTGNATYNLPSIAGGSSDTVCLESLGNCVGAPSGSAGGDLTGSYPNPTIADLQGKTLTLSSLVSGQVLQYNGSAIVNGYITNSNLQSGNYANITGTGSLSTGSITSGFGAISTGNNISTSANVQGANLNATTTLQLNGVNINNAGTLNNVAYLNQNQSFSGSNTFSGSLLSQDATNSATAFSVQNSSGSSIFNADTSNNAIGVAGASTAAGYALNVNGNVNASSNIYVNGIAVCTVTACAASSGSNNFIDNSTTAQSANIYVQAASSGSVAAILQANSSGSGDILDLKNSAGTAVTTFGSSGSALFKTSTNSTSALQVQSSSSTSILDVDTTNSAVGIDGASTSAGYAFNVTGSLNASNGIYDGGVRVCTSAGCAPVAGSSNYIQNTTTLQTASNFNIQSASASSVGGVIEDDTSQTADLLDFRNSSATNLVEFTSAGYLQGGNASGTNIAGTNLVVAGGEGTGTGSGGNLNFDIYKPSATSGSSLNSTAATVFSLSGTNGAATFENSANSTTAFQVQNAATYSVLTVDTVDGSVIIKGGSGAASPSTNLITNSTNFTSYWSGSNWTLSSSSATHVAGSGNTTALTYTGYGFSAGISYELVFSFSGASGNGTDSITPNIGTTAGQTIYASSDTNETQIITPSASGNLSFTPTASWAGSITSVAIYRMTPANANLQDFNQSNIISLEYFASTNPGTTFLGNYSGSNDISGSYDTALGANALQSNTSANNNTAIGYNSLQATTTGGGNTALGYETLQDNTVGQNNTAIGGAALQDNTTGSSNLGIGVSALIYNTTGQDNTAVGGLWTLLSNTTGSDNTALGYLGLINNTTGSYNTALGYEAGFSDVANITGSNNTFLGYESGSSSASLQDATAIGSNAVVGQNNSIVLGCINAVNGCAASTSVGIGTTTPSATLNVVGTDLFKSSTNSTTAFQVQNTGGSDIFDTDTTNSRVGIGTNAPGNLLSIGALATASSTSQIAVSTGGATNSGIVVQTVAGQSSGYILQAQNSSGSTLASIDYQGNLMVQSATINGTLTINGHVVTGNASSGTTTATVNANAGSGGICSVSGNDTGGQVTITTGTASWAAGIQCTINFASSYTNTPHPVMSKANSTSTSIVQPYVNSSTGNWTIDFSNPDTATNTYIFNYFNAQ